MNDSTIRTTVHGRDAVFAVTAVAGGTYPEELTIIETRGGIDCDNAGRSYSHEREVQKDDLLWSVLNHVAFHGTEGIHATYEGAELGSNTQVATIHLDAMFSNGSLDSESFGYTYDVRPSGVRHVFED